MLNHLIISTEKMKPNLQERIEARINELEKMEIKSKEQSALTNYELSFLNKILSESDDVVTWDIINYCTDDMKEFSVNKFGITTNIYSVRVTKGKEEMVLQIDDITDKGKIKEFKILDCDMKIRCDNSGVHMWHDIIELTKLPQPVAVLKDYLGNDLFATDTFYFQSMDGKILKDTIDKMPEIFPNHYKIFKHKSDAENYLIQRSEKINIDEAMDGFFKCIASQYLRNSYKEYLTNIVRKKLNL